MHCECQTPLTAFVAITNTLHLQVHSLNTVVLPHLITKMRTHLATLTLAPYTHHQLDLGDYERALQSRFIEIRDGIAKEAMMAAMSAEKWTQKRSKKRRRQHTNDNADIDKREEQEYTKTSKLLTITINMLFDIRAAAAIVYAFMTESERLRNAMLDKKRQIAQKTICDVTLREKQGCSSACEMLTVYIERLEEINYFAPKLQGLLHEILQQHEGMLEHLLAKARENNSERLIDNNIAMSYTNGRSTLAIADCAESDRIPLNSEYSLGMQMKESNSPSSSLNPQLAGQLDLSSRKMSDSGYFSQTTGGTSVE